MSYVRKYKTQSILGTT